MAGNTNSGRRAKPAALHIINGNPSKKSEADLAMGGGQPVVPPAGVPECPLILTPAAQEEWNRIAPDLQVMGLLSRIDQAELAIYCQAYADWQFFRGKLSSMQDDVYVETTPSGYKQMSVWMQLANRAEDRARTAGASFGLNPSARARLQVRAPQGELFPNAEKETASKYF